MSIITSDLQQAVDANIQTAVGSLPDFKSAKVSVTWNGGQTAGTRWQVRDGRLESNINMPTLPMNAVLNRFEADVMTGFAIHEIGHNICTDMDVWKEACRFGPAYTNVLNALEDPRMEKDLVSRGRFAGAKRVLELLTQHMVEVSKLNGWHPSNPQGLAFTINTLAYIEWCGYDVPQAGDILAEAGPLAADIRMWTDKLMQCRTTADCWVLTQEMVDHYPQQQPEQQQPEQGDSDQSERNDSFEQSDDADQQDGDEHQEDQQGAAGDQQDGDQQDGDEHQEDQSGGGSGAIDAPLPQSGEDAHSNDTGINPNMFDQMQTERDVSSLADDISDRTDDEASDYWQMPSHQTLDEIIAGTDEALQAAKDKEKRVRKHMPKNAGAAKQRITRLLRNPDRRGEHRNRNRGRLDRGRLHRLATGNDNVFVEKWQRAGVRTAVSVVLDNSGSMDGDNNRDATVLGLIMGDALAAANIRFQIGCFPAMGRCRIPAKRKKKAWTFGTEQVDVSWNAAASGHEDSGSCTWGRDGKTGDILKSFGTPWSKAKHTVSLMHGYADGGTPLCTNLLATARQMRHMDEDKKVIFIMSDGGAGEGVSVLKDTVKLANQWGIKVVCLSIGWGETAQEFADCGNAGIVGMTAADLIDKLDEIASALD